MHKSALLTLLSEVQLQFSSQIICDLNVVVLESVYEGDLW